MENSIYIGLSRQAALRRQMSQVANNIANMNTTGFKRELMIYQAYETKIPFTQTNDFVIDRGSAIDHSPGAMRLTGNTFDLAIDGPGYFQVDDGTGTFYTRNGTFSLDENNQLVTNQGYQVLDAGGEPIFVPRSDEKIVIESDGSVRLGDDVYGRIAVVEFDNMIGVRKVRGSLFESDELPRPAENSEVQQGLIETSNVSPILELTNMIEVSRAYDSVKNMISSENDRTKQALERLARPVQGGA
ncbi:MAG: flagellar basal-body rod protein FlgF [Alphaproteobacteria bacterium]|nr:flagellar basal-body rod protein FlgF [Alphaproteobacteria bacterium]